MKAPNVTLIILSMITCIGMTTVRAQDFAGLISPPIGSYFSVADSTYKVNPDRPISFIMHFTVVTDTVKGYTHGIHVYISDQPDGSTKLSPGPGFTPIVLDTVMPPGQWFDGIFATTYLGVDGIGADSVRYGSFSIWNTGIPVGFDGDVLSINTEVSSAIADQGYYLCIDTASVHPGSSWLWSTLSQNVWPEWGGPYCYEIATCCTGSLADLDGDGMVNIGDLTILIGYVFPPNNQIPCGGAGNVDGISVGGTPINITDITHLVSYIFRGGPAPADCGA